MPATVASPRPQPSERVLTAVLVRLMVAANALFFMGLVTGGGTPDPFVTLGLSLGTQWFPVAIFWLAVYRTGFRRPEVVLAATGATMSAAGDVYYSLAADAEGYLPFPSFADLGFLLFYPFMIAAVVILVRRHTAGRSVVIESIVAGLGAGALVAVLVDPLVSAAITGDQAFASTVALAYPIFDLLILAVIAAVAAAPNLDVGRRWWSLAVGLLLFTAADLVYSLAQNSGAYIANTPMDATWTVGLAFMAWWVADLGIPRTEAEAPRRKPVWLSVPALGAFAGLSVLLAGTVVPLSALAIVLAGLTLAFAIVPIISRQAAMARVVTSQQHVMEQLTALDRDKSAMMLTMNHEFRTPITTINGYVELLLDGDAGDMPREALGMLKAIERSGTRLHELVEALLTMAKLEAGGAAGAFVPTELDGLLQRAASSLAPVAQQYKVSVSVADTALVVDADSGQLERAMTNLIHNAIKFSPPHGSVAVTSESSPTDDMVLVRVTDRGMGIEPEDRGRLFTPFFRGRNAEAAAIPGAGLGLSIARAVIEAHGGHIDVSSTPGAGTTVIVALPKSKSNDRARVVADSALRR